MNASNSAIPQKSETRNPPTQGDLHQDVKDLLPKGWQLTIFPDDIFPGNVCYRLLARSPNSAYKIAFYKDASMKQLQQSRFGNFHENEYILIQEMVAELSRSVEALKRAGRW